MCEPGEIEVILLNVIYSQQALNLPSFGWTPVNLRARLAIAKWNFSFWIRKVGMHACRRPRPWVVWAWPLRFDPRPSVNRRDKIGFKTKCVCVLCRFYMVSDHTSSLKTWRVAMHHFCRAPKDWNGIMCAWSTFLLVCRNQMESRKAWDTCSMGLVIHLHLSTVHAKIPNGNSHSSTNQNLHPGGRNWNCNQ